MLAQESSSINNSNTDLAVVRTLFTSGQYEQVIEAARPLCQNASLDIETRFASYLLIASAESELGYYSESLETLKAAGPLLDNALPRQKASFYGQRAHVNAKLKKKDSPLVDYEAARFWAQEAGDQVVEARVRNNLAKRYSEIGRIVEAIAEVDAAIKIAVRLQDDHLLGRFYDQKAQVLLDDRRFVESIACSKKALMLLEGHPALTEARTTHGRALIALGVSFLPEPKTIEDFCIRRDAAKSLQVALTPDVIKRALKGSGGHVLKAAEVLNVSHPVLIRSIEKHGIERQPIRPRRKSLIKK